MKKTLLLNIVFCVASLSFLWAIGKNFYEKMGFVKNQAARGEMRVLMPSLQIEDSATKVGARFGAGRFKHLKLRTKNPRLWSVNTPMEMGAINWTLFLEFDNTAKLTAIRLRTPDGVSRRPHDVQVADRVRPNWTSPMESSWNRS